MATAPRTEQAYVGWVRRFVRCHGTRHPSELGAEEVRDFLSHLATERNVAASTQNQALAALLFLYRAVLEAPLPQIEGLQPARKPKRLPAVLRRDEVRAVLRELDGTPALVCALLSGEGLRLLEAVRLRVKDVDLEMQSITVRDGKGTKDRITVLPASVVPRLREHLEHVRILHERDLSTGHGAVFLPQALDHKYTNTAHRGATIRVTRLGSFDFAPACAGRSLRMSRLGQPFLLQGRSKAGGRLRMTRQGDAPFTRSPVHPPTSTSLTGPSSPDSRTPHPLASNSS